MEHKEGQTRTQGILNFPIIAPFDLFYRNHRIDYPVGPHSHDGAELYFTLSDLPDVLLNDTVSAVPAGTLIIIPPFCVHQLYHEIGKTYERYVLSIHSQWLDSVFCHNTGAFPYLKEGATPLLLKPDDTMKATWVSGLEQFLSYPSPTTPEAMNSFFQLMLRLSQMSKQFSTQDSYLFPISSTQETVNKVIAYIQEHIYENLTVADLAAHFYLHPDYLSRLFKKHAHTSVSHYMALQKTATAQSLLREGYTVAQVQEKLNYSSYAYFFKAFQKNAGVSPSKYREQARTLWED